MLLSNAEVYDSQRISILSSAASTNEEEDFDNDAANDQYLDAVKYSSIASTLRQCDRTQASNIRPTVDNTASAASSTTKAPLHFRHRNNNGGGSRPPSTKTRITPDQLAALKS